MLKVQPLTLHAGPAGFIFVDKHLDATLQSSAEVTLHASTLLDALYPPKKMKDIILSFSQKSSLSFQQSLPFASH